MEKEKRSSKSTYQFIIILLAALLALSIMLLAVVLLKQRSDEVSLRDNVIGGEIGETLPETEAPEGGLHSHMPIVRTLGLLSGRSSDLFTLSWWTGYDGETQFKVSNMLPGDSETKEYKIKIKNRNAKLLMFEMAVVKSEASLPEEYILESELLFTVKADGVTLCEDVCAKDMQVLSYEVRNGVSEQEVAFAITATLPTSAGNECAGKSLKLDFKWTLGADPVDTTTTQKPETETPPSPPGPIDTDPVETDPVETDPIVTDPVETDPIDTDPIDTDPVETDPIDTDPIDTDPVETDPIETDPPVTLPIIDPPHPPHGGVFYCGEHCFFCGFWSDLFDIDVRSIVCRFVTWLFGSDEFICVCPWGCFIIPLIIIVGIAILIIWLLKRKKKEVEEKAADEINNITDVGDEE
jgi:hypothetical protein